MSLVCSVIFIHHAFNANILDKDYAFSDGEILMVDNAHGVSGPSRAAIMTGRAPARFGVYSNTDAQGWYSANRNFLA